MAIKVALLDQRLVAGLGNIYASESLHRAGIHPTRPARRVSHARYAALVTVVREVLELAIGFGGTTLRDFTRDDGKPGYFRNELLVYDRAGQPCLRCGTELRRSVIDARGTTWCPGCQRRWAITLSAPWIVASGIETGSPHHNFGRRAT